jgi:putative transposase
MRLKVPTGLLDHYSGKLWTQSYFVETIGNANEETIRKYAQNQLIELDVKEQNAKQLGLF